MVRRKASYLLSAALIALVCVSHEALSGQATPGPRYPGKMMMYDLTTKSAIVVKELAGAI